MTDRTGEYSFFGSPIFRYILACIITTLIHGIFIGYFSIPDYSVKNPACIPVKLIGVASAINPIIDSDYDFKKSQFFENAEKERNQSNAPQDQHKFVTRDEEKVMSDDIDKIISSNTDFIAAHDSANKLSDKPGNVVDGAGEQNETSNANTSIKSFQEGDGNDKVENNGAVEQEENKKSVSAIRERILTEYKERILNEISRNKQYPVLARRLKQEGNVGVRFTVNKDGRIFNIQIENPSGFPLLDEAALNAIGKSSPVSGIPIELGKESLTLSLNIVFSLD